MYPWCRTALPLWGLAWVPGGVGHGGPGYSTGGCQYPWGVVGVLQGQDRQIQGPGGQYSGQVQIQRPGTGAAVGTGPGTGTAVGTGPGTGPGPGTRPVLGPGQY